VALFWALVTGGKWDRAMAMVAQDPDLANAPYDGFGWTPLMEACLSATTHEVEALVARGALVNATDEETGATALFVAVSDGLIDMVTCLLRLGVDPSIADSEGSKSCSAIDWALVSSVTEKPVPCACQRRPSCRPAGGGIRRS
jgi:ankyrin repeat protein